MKAIYIKKSLYFIKIFFDGEYWCYAAKSIWRGEKTYSIIEDSFETKTAAVTAAENFLEKSC
jgi:hypothetical protein